MAVVNREVLIETLRVVEPAAATKVIVEQSDCAIFTQGVVLAYNGEDVAIAHPTDLADDIEGAVELLPLLNTLDRMTAPTLELSTVGGKLVLDSGRSKLSLPVRSDIRLPYDEVEGFMENGGGEEEYKPLPEDFSEGVGIVLPTIGGQKAIPTLQAVHIAGNVAQTTDNYRATCYYYDEDDTNFPEFLIGGEAAKAIVNTSPFQYAISEGWAHFTNERGTHLSCSRRSSNYPDLSQQMGNTKGAIEFTVPESVGEVLERAGEFADQGAMSPMAVMVRLSPVKGGLCVIRGMNVAGTFEEEVDIPYKGEKVDIFVNPFYLKFAAELGTKMEIRGDKVVVTADAFDHMVQLVTPTGDS